MMNDRDSLEKWQFLQWLRFHSQFKILILTLSFQGNSQIERRYNRWYLKILINAFCLEDEFDSIKSSLLLMPFCSFQQFFLFLSIENCCCFAYFKIRTALVHLRWICLECFVLMSIWLVDHWYFILHQCSWFCLRSISESLEWFNFFSISAWYTSLLDVSKSHQMKMALSWSLVISCQMWGCWMLDLWILVRRSCLS